MKNINRENCRHLNGYKPCRFHKETKTSCSGCNHYEPLSTRILIIKIGAAGDVVRHTPILRKLRELYPRAEITWLTSFPELVPASFVDRILRYDWESAFFLTQEKFDLLLSFDKEPGASALATQVKAKIKKGFCYSDSGRIRPFDFQAQDKWETGIDDIKMLQNTKHFVKEIFEICGYEWSGERYILPDFSQKRLFQTDKVTVGLNTGAGGVWRTRVPHLRKIEEIIQKVTSRGYEVILLGGPAEHQKNLILSKKHQLRYFGVRPLLDYINVINHCDLVITPVSMALHLAVGLDKSVLVLNNIFNRHEFYLYEKGAVLEPPLSCLGCYKTEFDKACPVGDCTLLYDCDRLVTLIEAMTPAEKR